MPDTAGVRVRPFAAEDLDEADRICRVAFGTFLGMPEPEKFFGDADYVRTRWNADRSAGLAAEVDGRLAGSKFAADWGSVGFFGPLTVAPEYWGRAIAQRLLDATMDLFAAWQTRHVGLFTLTPQRHGVADSSVSSVSRNAASRSAPSRSRQSSSRARALLRMVRSAARPYVVRQMSRARASPGSAMRVR